ncbi:MAG: T9SS type A sorting domain-containing protein [Bacteroidales bacterium]|nr:T9SS type A sorting domain-containing protein [Bacteroidales bacterium]MCF8456250.1 T9SS type A sorting domain-containing protein [Bacteroidales bacterium]
MKKIALSIIGFAICVSLYAQTVLTTAVDFTHTDTDGAQHNLFDYLNNGNYVVLNFFFTTCGACQNVAPTINQAYINFGCNTGNVVFLGINNGDTNAEVDAFRFTYNMWMPSISGIDGGANMVCFDYNVTMYPTAVLIAPDKTILEQGMDISTMDSIIENHGGILQPCMGMLNPTYGIEPVTAFVNFTTTFTDHTVGNITSRQWAFDGGIPNTSNDSTVDVLFSTVGTYGVTLTVTNGTETHSIFDSITVVAPGPPVPYFYASQTIIYAGDSINFIDISTYNPDTWQWTFVGGNPVQSVDQSPTFIKYNFPGIFNVYLSTSNNWGTTYLTKFSYITVLEGGSIAEGCDTISNLNAYDTLVVENLPGGGIIPGVNNLNISQYADEFTLNRSNYNQLFGLNAYVRISQASSPSSIVSFKVWTGLNSPDLLLSTKEIAIENLPAGAFGTIYTVLFDSIIDITGLNKVFVGYEILPIGNDQFACSMAADRGPTGPSTMHMYHNNNWIKSEDLAVAGGFHTSLGVELIILAYTNNQDISSEHENVSLFPNPTKGEISILYGSNKSEDYQIKVYNSMGMEVGISQTKKDNKTNLIDFEGNSNGIYFITLTNNMQVITKKVILNR